MPITDHYYALYEEGGYIFPRAVGQGPEDDKNCFFLDNGLMTSLVTDQQNIATDVVITQLTKEAFETAYTYEAEGAIYIQTTIEDLKKAYIGKLIQDF